MFISKDHPVNLIYATTRFTQQFVVNAAGL